MRLIQEIFIALASAVLLAFLFYYGSIYSYGIMLSSVLGMCFLGSVLLPLVVTFYFIRRKKKSRVWFYSFIPIVSMLVAIHFSKQHNSQEVEKKKEAAQEIILALDAYKSSNGAYPESLSDLQMPSKVSGYFYNHLKNPDGFYIGFPVQAWMLCTYTSMSKKWIMDD